MSLQMIKHRVNRIADLSKVQPDWGAEIDLRSDVSTNGAIHLSHDPWSTGDRFEAWLDRFKELKIRGPLILNTKEDGLEARVLELLQARDIRSYFFLDTALPTLVRWTMREGRDEFAVRVSRYEPLECALAFRGHASWAWVDCFGGEPLSVEAVRRLKPEFKICLVSPELQGRPLADVTRFAALAELADAVCTKEPGGWGG